MNGMNTNVIIFITLNNRLLRVPADISVLFIAAKHQGTVPQRKKHPSEGEPQGNSRKPKKTTTNCQRTGQCKPNL